MSFYSERAVGGSLGALVEAAWQARIAEPTSDWLVLPDGCVDLVFTAGHDGIVAGPATRPSVHAFVAGTTAVGVRLRPGAASAVLGVAAHELRDRSVPTRDMPALTAFDRVEAAVAHGDAEEALRHLVGALRAELHAKEPDGAVVAVASALRARPRVSVADLGGEVAISSRHLRRRFTEHVGYGPARFARLVRLQRALALHRHDPTSTFASLAAGAGYADQSHLARDCRELAGRSAHALLEQRDAIAD